jgi:hypothetical protein
MKHLKNWIKFLESADSPELVGKFSPYELKKMSKADVFDDSPYRKFQQGFYAGGGSNDLNNSLSDAKQKGYGSMYGISDYLLNELRKAVPDFKDYKLDEYKDMYSDFYDGKLGLHLKKEKKLESTRFDAESEIWVYYHTKGNKWLDYKKGKIYVLFTCGLRPTEKSFDLMGGSKKESTPEDDVVRKSFSDMITTKPSSCPDCKDEDEIELDDKGFDKFCSSLNDVLYGHPDKEDENLHNKLQIYKKNLSIENFLKTLPKVKENINFFKRYLLNKYNLKF